MRIFRDVTTEMIRESRPVERAVQHSFVAHSLKRVCDQCANIAESTIFIRRAVDYKHKCSPCPAKPDAGPPIGRVKNASGGPGGLRPRTPTGRSFSRGLATCGNSVGLWTGQTG